MEKIMDFDAMRKELDDAIANLADDMAHIQTGRATTELIEEIKIEAYGTQSPLQNLANLAVSDAKSMTVQPWDKTLIDLIAKSITNANLGLSVSSEGNLIRVRVPELTEERRAEYVKVMKDRTESTRQQLRAVRQKYMKDIDAQVKEAGLPEDDGKRFKEEVEKAIKEMNEKVEEMKDAKEKDLMTI